MTFLLVIVIIYVYTIIGFTHYRDEYSTDVADSSELVCDKMYKCFFYTLDSGALSLWVMRCSLRAVMCRAVMCRAVTRCTVPDCAVRTSAMPSLRL
jgi:hypothetical protein